MVAIIVLFAFGCAGAFIAGMLIARDTEISADDFWPCMLLLGSLLLVMLGVLLTDARGFDRGYAKAVRDRQSPLDKYGN